MFEMFNRKPKTPQERDKDRRNALIGAAGLAAVGAAATHEEIPDLSTTNAPITAEAPSNNPTLGMRAGDAPEKVIIPAPAAETTDTAVVDLAEKQVVVDFTEDDQQIVQHPEQ
jgi:hypothetical protein